MKISNNLIVASSSVLFTILNLAFCQKVYSKNADGNSGNAKVSVHQRVDKQVRESAKTDKASGYNLPPKEILDVMRALPPAKPIVSPSKDKILLVYSEDYPSLERVSTGFLRMAGVRLEPNNRSRHDTPGGYGIPACVNHLDLFHIQNETQVSINLKDLKCPSEPLWNADGKYFLLINRSASKVELWVGNGKTGRLTEIKNLRLNAMLSEEAQWMPDQKTILVKLVPEKQAKPPTTEIASQGPSISESNGEKGQSSTYEKRDTLNNKHDEALFDYYALSQLALVDASSGKITKIGKPDLYDMVRPSPDGKYVLLSEIQHPYSYVTTYSRFPHKVETWNISDSQKLKVKVIAELPLTDRVPIHGVPKGPRQFSWRAPEGSTLVWAEALDGGDWNVNVPARDKVIVLNSPFESQPAEVLQTEQRFSDIDWFEDSKIALLSEYDNNRHWQKTFIVNFDNPKAEKKLLWDLSEDERYGFPGYPVHKMLKNGYLVVRHHQNSIFLVGQGASSRGDRPFLDQLDMSTLKSKRFFRSDNVSYERFLSFLDEDEKSFLTWHQSVTDMPNVHKRTLGQEISSSNNSQPEKLTQEKAASDKSDKAANEKAKSENSTIGNSAIGKSATDKATTEGAETVEAAYSSSSVALTNMQDPTPQVRQIKKRLVKYKRADGLDLSFTLYTPPGYKEGTRVPTILYAYPLDYAEASKAGQITGSDQTFTRLFGYRLLLMSGYAIVDRAAFPIVGDPKKAYDTYLEQLTADATAAVGEAVKLGVADPDHIGVTGHSHGALMTVNLLAHTNLFRAGIATSGSYNKMITPFGFQNERRSVWEAFEVYHKVSPYFMADKIKLPLLIIHGSEDANPGTTPLQANLLYDAVRGNGGTARLVMLPHEPHWYTARESNEQEVYEMLRWFDLHVKSDRPLTSPATTKQ